jgi:hypothetical protein
MFRARIHSIASQETITNIAERPPLAAISSPFDQSDKSIQILSTFSPIVATLFLPPIGIELLEESDRVVDLLLILQTCISHLGTRDFRFRFLDGRVILKARRFCIVPAGATAVYAHSNRSAAQRNHHARSRAISMSAPATLPGLSLAPRASNSRGVSAKRSRCGLHTSSAS